MSHVTTHVLDTVHGRPAVGLGVTLMHRGSELATGATDAEGRVPDLGPDALHAGTYTLVYDTGAWYADRGIASCFPEVCVTVAIDGEGGDHVELRLSPCGYSVSRG